MPSRKGTTRSRSRPLLVRAPSEEKQRGVIARRLRMKLGVPVELEVTDNTYTMVSYARKRDAYRVRIHHMFLLADDEVLAQVAAYIRGEGRHASAVLDRYIHEHRRLIRTLSPVQRQRRLPLKSKGHVHDLQVLLDEVRTEWFTETARNVAIAWAPVPPVRLPRRSIKLGSYSADTQIVRIHPALDQPAVPAYFVKWIIFHELLHHVFRADLKARRRRVHTPEFCRLERRFPQYPEAIKWERKHLDLLLWWAPRLQRLRSAS